MPHSNKATIDEEGGAHMNNLQTQQQQQQQQLQNQNNGSIRSRPPAPTPSTSFISELSTYSVGEAFSTPSTTTAGGRGGGNGANATAVTAAGPTTTTTTATTSASASISAESTLTTNSIMSRRDLLLQQNETIDKVTLGPGITLEGMELEDFCKKRGLCPLCAKTKTRRRVFKLFKKNKWEPLTVPTEDGTGYTVYKGYCVKTNCFTLEQAKILCGEGRSNSNQHPQQQNTASNAGGGEEGGPDQMVNSKRYGPQPNLLRNTSMRTKRRSVMKGSSSARINNFNGSSNNDNSIVNNKSNGRHNNMNGNNNHNNSVLNNIRSFGSKSPDINDMDSTTDDPNQRHVHNRTHKPDPHAFPPPGLKSTRNFQVFEDRPFFVVEKTVTALQDDCIRILDLSNLEELRPIDFHALSNAVRVNTTLQSLILENCRLTDESLNILAEGLHEAKDIPLTKLYLRSNVIGDDGVDALCPFLEATVTLEKIDVSRNRVGSRGTIGIFNAFRRNRLTRIRCINLSHNEIWNLNENRFGIQTFLARNRTLQVLNLEANYIHDDGCEAMTQGLLQNDQTALERLYLGWNSIGDDGTIALAQMLESNTSLRVLGLGENAIKNAGARALLSALDYNTTLREISGLWRNHIDRRFIIVAIRRLLLSPDRDSEHFTHSANQAEAGATTTSASASVSNPKAPSKGPSRTNSIEQAPRNNDQHQYNSDFDSGKLTLESANSSVSGGGGGGGTVKSANLLSLGNDDSMDPDYFDDTTLTSATSNNHRNNYHSIIDKSTRSETSSYAGGSSQRHERGTPYDCLTVFQSAPLAYFDRESGLHKAVPLLNYKQEVTTIKEAVKEAIGAEIDVRSEAASLDRFSEFFTGKQGEVMHFTCFGHSEQLELENGYGSLHTLPVDGLRRLVDDGGQNLKVVFVSSCQSRAIGQVFVDAGVPHVVCCQREPTYNDLVVSEFEHKFYRALANNKLLQQAFDIALKAVNSSYSARRSRLVTERFVLLPEPENDNELHLHEVPVFFTQSKSENLPIQDDTNLTYYFPSSPDNFLGREVDMYEILEALRVDDVVKIISPPGHGKDSVVAAVCEYAMQRRAIFSVDDIFWIPAPEGVTPEEDSLYGDLCLTINILKNSKEDIWETDEVLLECRERIEIELEDMQVVMVVDDRDFRFRGAQEGLEKFITHLLNSANAKVLLITSKSSEMASVISSSTMGSRIEEASIEIGPLDFKSTARLFGENSKFVASNGCPAAHSGNEFAELLEPAFISKMPDPSLVISQRRSDLFVRMGSGLPSRVISAAANMSKEDFIDLIGIANRPEVFVDSLGALEKQLEFRKLQRQKALEDRNYMRVMDLDIILEELEGMRPEFPTLNDLREEEKLMKEELAAAVKNRKYDTANDLKRELLTLKKKIMKESRQVNDNSKDANDRLHALQAQVQSMIEGTELAHVNIDTNMKSATFAVHCDGRDCSFVIYPGEVYDFEHPSEAMGIVCWGNESCELQGTDVGEKLAKKGGPLLEEDISQLPIKLDSRYGPIRCGTGNALILGPEKYGDLEAPCVILSVGPLSPNDSQVDAVEDDTDCLHYITMMLRSCYRSSLVLARHAELQALAISLLTTRKEGEAYGHTLRLGLQTLIEEVKFSHLRDLHIMASSQKEASILIAMMSEMGYRQI